MLEDNLGLPDADTIPGDDRNTPFFLIGDDAFPFKTWMLKPYSRRNLTDDERIFNYRKRKQFLSLCSYLISNILPIHWKNWPLEICKEGSDILLGEEVKKGSAPNMKSLIYPNKFQD